VNVFLNHTLPLKINRKSMIPIGSSQGIDSAGKELVTFLYLPMISG
jgi:hypothetical protein